MSDLISRSRAIKEVSEWATDILHPKNLIKEDAIGILESLPSAQGGDADMNEVKSPFMQQSPNDGADLISRQDAIDALNKEYHGMLSDESMKIYQIKNWLSALPSADRPTGEWVDKDGKIICSLCGNSVSFSRIENSWRLGRFCQSCGAKMGGGE